MVSRGMTLLLCVALVASVSAIGDASLLRQKLFGRRATRAGLTLLARGKRVNDETCALTKEWKAFADLLAPFTQYNNWGHEGTLLQHSVWTAHASGNYFSSPSHGVMPDLGTFSDRDAKVMTVCGFMHDIGKALDTLSEPHSSFPYMWMADGSEKTAKQAEFEKLGTQKAKDEWLYGKTISTAGKKEAAPPCFGGQTPPACEPRTPDNADRHDMVGYNFLVGEKQVKSGFNLYEAMKTAVGNTIDGGWKPEDIGKCAFMVRFHYQSGDFANTQLCGSGPCRDNLPALSKLYSGTIGKTDDDYLTMMLSYKKDIEEKVAKNFNNKKAVTIDWDGKTLIRASWFTAMSDPSANKMVQPVSDTQFSTSIQKGSCNDLSTACATASKSKYSARQCELVKDSKTFYDQWDGPQWLADNCPVINAYCKTKSGCNGIDLNCGTKKTTPPTSPKKAPTTPKK